MIDFDDILKANITKLRTMSFANSTEENNEKPCIIIKNISFLQNMIKNPLKYEFVESIFIVKELLEVDVNCNILSKYVNDFIQQLNKFKNIHSLIIIDIKNIIFPKGIYHLRTLISNISINSKSRNEYSIYIDQEAMFPSIETIGCEEINYGKRNEKKINLFKKFNNKFPKLNCIYGWLLHYNNTEYDIEDVYKYFSKYKFIEFDLNNFIPYTFFIDIDVSDSEYFPSSCSECDDTEEDLY